MSDTLKNESDGKMKLYDCKYSCNYYNKVEGFVKNHGCNHCNHPNCPYGTIAEKRKCPDFKEDPYSLIGKLKTDKIIKNIFGVMLLIAPIAFYFGLYCAYAFLKTNEVADVQTLFMFVFVSPFSFVVHGLLFSAWAKTIYEWKNVEAEMKS